MRTQKKLVIHPSTRSPKLIILTLSDIDYNYILYRNSRSPQSCVKSEKNNSSSATAEIVKTEAQIEDIVRPIPRKPDYEGSESTYTDNYHYEKETKQTADIEATSIIEDAEVFPQQINCIISNVYAFTAQGGSISIK